MQKKIDFHKYDDIIFLPRHVSKTHAPMPIEDRAAQFAPFAALTGFGDAVKETERLTDARIELCEDEAYALDVKIKEIERRIEELPQVTITFFVKDAHKEGGAYRTVSGTLKRIDRYRRRLVLEDGMQIPMEDVLDIKG